MNTDGAAAQFHAVQHGVIALGAHPAGIGQQILQILFVGHGEGVVHGQIAALLLRPLELGKVRHEAEAEIILAPQAQHIAYLQPQTAQRAADGGELVRAEEDEVAVLRVQRGQQGFPLFLGEILLQNRVDLAVLMDEDPRHTLRAVAEGMIGEGLHGGAGELFGTALAVDGTHHAALIRYLAEHGEAARGGNVRHVEDGEAEAQVGLVAAVLVHALLPRQAGKGIIDLPAHDLLEHGFEEPLKMPQNVLLLHKGHFHIHLRELRLTVGAQVFIPEASGHLIILVNAAHHQQLLEDLRALGQGVELAVVHPAGHQIIPRTLRGGLGEHGGLHREEALAVQIILSALLHPMAEAQPLHHLRAAQVQVAVLQPQLVLHARVIQREGQRICLAGHLQLHRTQFHSAGGQLFVHGLLIAQADGAFHRNYGFVFQLIRRRKFLRRELGRVEHHLQNAFPVPQVHENNAAHIPLGLHPAAGYGGFADVCFPVQAAILGTLQHTLSLQNKKPHIRSSSKSVCGAKKHFRGATHLGLTRQARLMQR